MRVGTGDQRFNHWTAVRNGLMNAHADLFPQIPAIMKMLPDEIDQMKPVRTHPDHPHADARRTPFGQLRGLSYFRSEDHGIFAQ